VSHEPRDGAVAKGEGRKEENMGSHPEVGLLVSLARPHPNWAREMRGRSLQDQKGRGQDQGQRQNLGSH